MELMLNITSGNDNPYEKKVSLIIATLFKSINLTFLIFHIAAKTKQTKNTLLWIGKWIFV